LSFSFFFSLLTTVNQTTNGGGGGSGGIWGIRRVGGRENESRELAYRCGDRGWVGQMGGGRVGLWK